MLACAHRQADPGQGMEQSRIEQARTAWQVYESNVQQYRALSVTVQSFFLTVGSLVATSSRDGISAVVVMALVAAVGTFHLVAIWHLPLKARHKIVDYYKFTLDRGLSEARIVELQALCSADQYVNDAALRRRVNAEFFGKPDLKVFRTTRFKFDIVVPGLYAAIWTVLLAWTAWSNL